MKKMAIAVAVAMVLTLVTPAFAALEITAGGKLDALVEYHKNEEGKFVLDAYHAIQLDTGVNIGEEGSPVSMRLEFANPTFGGGYNDDELDKTQGFDNWAHVGSPLGALTLKKAYIEAQGAYWDGGPEVHTRIGDVDIKYHDWVAHLGGRKGITVENIEYGPLSAKAFYALDGERASGLSLATELFGVEAEGIAVRHSGNVEMAADLRTDLTEDIEVNGRLALDADRDKAYRFGATAQLAENLTVNGEFRNSDPEYGASFANADEQPTAGETAYKVGMDTNMMGVELGADYETVVDGDQTVTIEASTEYAGVGIEGTTEMVNWQLAKTTVGLSKDFPVTEEVVVTGTYDLEIVHADETLVHELGASTTLNMIPQLQNLGLNAGLTLETGQELAWNVGATYNAPNGIELGAAYDSQEGPSMTAGISVAF